MAPSELCLAGEVAEEASSARRPPAPRLDVISALSRSIRARIADAGGPGRRAGQGRARGGRAAAGRPRRVGNRRAAAGSASMRSTASAFDRKPRVGVWERCLGSICRGSAYPPRGHYAELCASSIAPSESRRAAGPRRPDRVDTQSESALDRIQGPGRGGRHLRHTAQHQDEDDVGAETDREDGGVHPKSIAPRRSYSSTVNVAGPVRTRSQSASRGQRR